MKTLMTLATAGILAAGTAWADVTVVVTGSTAFRAIALNRAAAILPDATIVDPVPANSNRRSFLHGHIAGQAGLGNVTLHLSFSGSGAGMKATRDQTAISLADGSTAVAQAAFSDVFPESAGIDGSVFTQDVVGVVPFVFIKNISPGNSIGSVTNLTQRQVTYLMSAAGTLPTAYFGGSSTTDPLYLVGRDSGSGSRICTEACVYFSGTPANWALVNGQPVLNPAGGYSSGSLVLADVQNLLNAIGYVSPPDSGTLPRIAYEGVTFTDDAVAQGKYSVWGYEHVVYKNSGAGQPSANQIVVLQALFNAIKDNTFQTTDANYAGRFVPLSIMEVERTADGGPITSTIY